MKIRPSPIWTIQTATEYQVGDWLAPILLGVKSPLTIQAPQT